MESEKIDRNILKYKFQANKQEGKYTIALYLIQTYFIKTIDTHEREMYIFREGHYVPAMNFLRGEAQEILGSMATTQIKNEIIGQVMDMTLVDREIFNTDPNLINLQNGVLNLETKEILPHSPDYCFLSKIPINFNPEATCPIILKFFEEILQEKDIPVAEEWIGFLLLRKYLLKKALIIVGDRDVGKTTFLNLLESFIGKDNISGISLQKLAGDKFSVANLYQKYANIYDDMSAKDINDTATFKMATGQSSMTGENKFGSPFKFTNFAKLTFSCNSIPGNTKLDDPAYYSRWIVLSFIKRAENPDLKLGEKLSTSEELSGLLNLALRGLVRVMEIGKFSYPAEPHEIKMQMLRSGSPIARFAYEGIEEGIGEWISKESLYEEFIKFTNKNQMQAVTMIEFGKQLQNFAGYITDSKGSENGRQARGWRNVRTKGEEGSEDEIEKEWKEYEG